MWKSHFRDKTEEFYNSYKFATKRGKDKVLEEKNRKWERFREKIEDSSENNHELFYSVLRNMRTGRTKLTRQIRSKQGQILTNPLEITSRWREYFNEMLEHEKGIGIGIENEEVNMEVKSKIQWQEVQMAINELRNRKAPGMYNIRAEMLKYIGKTERFYYTT